MEKNKSRQLLGVVHLNEKDKAFERVLCEMNELYHHKNADYGDSFGQSFREFGVLSSVLRIGDKYRRMKNLCADSKHPPMVAESLRETLIDLANYAAMTIVELDLESAHANSGL